MDANKKGAPTGRISASAPGLPVPKNPVLLIDDDRMFGPAAIEVLTTLGHPTVWATSLGQACALLDGPIVFAVILLDLHIGRGHGETLVDARCEKSPLPPIVIISAQPLAELQAAAERVHAAAVLQKPCSVEEIVAAIVNVSGAHA